MQYFPWENTASQLIPDWSLSGMEGVTKTRLVVFSVCGIRSSVVNSLLEFNCHLFKSRGMWLAGLCRLFTSRGKWLAGVCHLFKSRGKRLAGIYLPFVQEQREVTCWHLFAVCSRAGRYSQQLAYSILTSNRSSEPLWTPLWSLPLSTTLWSLPLWTPLWSLPLSTLLWNLPLWTPLWSLPLPTPLWSLPLWTPLWVYHYQHRYEVYHCEHHFEVYHCEHHYEFTIINTNMKSYPQRQI